MRIFYLKYLFLGLALVAGFFIFAQPSLALKCSWEDCKNVWVCDYTWIDECKEVCDYIWIDHCRLVCDYTWIDCCEEVCDYIWIDYCRLVCDDVWNPCCDYVCNVDCGPWWCFWCECVEVCDCVGCWEEGDCEWEGCFVDYCDCEGCWEEYCDWEGCFMDYCYWEGCLEEYCYWDYQCTTEDETCGSDWTSDICSSKPCQKYYYSIKHTCYSKGCKSNIVQYYYNNDSCGGCPSDQKCSGGSCIPDCVDDGDPDTGCFNLGCDLVAGREKTSLCYCDNPDYPYACLDTSGIDCVPFEGGVCDDAGFDAAGCHRSDIYGDEFTKDKCGQGGWWDWEYTGYQYDCIANMCWCVDIQNCAEYCRDYLGVTNGYCFLEDPSGCDLIGIQTGTYVTYTKYDYPCDSNYDCYSIASEICEYDCGADAACDGVAVGGACRTGRTCDNNCKCPCTTDAHCTDPSKPKCNIATGVCVECLENDITYNDANTNNDRSSQCPPAKPRCDSPDVNPFNPTYTCKVPDPCNTNADCIPGECCTSDPTLQDKAAKSIDIDYKTCVDVGTPSGLRQPYLCTR